MKAMQLCTGDISQLVDSFSRMNRSWVQSQHLIKYMCFWIPILLVIGIQRKEDQYFQVILDE